MEVAARRINDDPLLNTELRIDSDTEGVPGQPPVTETILNKIGTCDIFAPDLTFVARTDGGKLIPNPNVMVEYGYALRAKSHAAMLPVMNTAFGPPGNLPFDMGHLRHPIQYCASPAAKNAERRAARKQLSENIEEALRIMLTAQIEQTRQANPFPEASPVRAPAFFFRGGEVVATAGYPGEQEFQFNFERAVYVRLFPSYADQPAVGLAKLVRIFEARKPCPMSLVMGGIPGRNQFGAIIHDPFGDSELWALTQGFDTGELWGLNGQVFRPHSTAEPITVIPMIGFEKIYCRVLNNYVRVAISDLQLRLPYTVELGATGLDGIFLAVPGGPLGNGEIIGPIMKNAQQRRYDLTSTTEGAINAVLRAYFSDFYDLVARTRTETLTDAIVAAHGLPSLV